MKKKSTTLIILSILLAAIANNSFAQTWPCAQYITRQVPNGSAYRTNISYVYDGGTTPVTVTVAKLDTLLNASVIYNGNIWAWKQYTGTAQSGSGGARLIKVNYNGLDSTVTPTLTGYSFPTITMGCNAAFVDPNGIYYVINTATSGANNFVLSRINLTTATPTLLTNLTVSLPSGSTLSSGGLGDLVYTPTGVFAFVNSVGLFQFTLPSTSTTSVTSNLVGGILGSINRTIGSLFYINSDLTDVYGYGSANGASTQDRLLKINTLLGTVTELTTSGISVSQSDGAGCPSTDFSQPIFLNISGNVFDDANGLMDNTVNGTGTNAGGTLYAQLLDGTNAVEATIPVASNGTYTFTGLTPGTYTVLINNSSTASTSTTLPSNWINTGEYNSISAGSDGNVNGKSAAITLTLTDVANVNFGIEQLPTANNVTASSQSNPGGVIKVTVPTLNGSDPEQGAFIGTGNLDTVIINTLPSNGILYYNNIAVSAGDTIKNYTPSLLTIDPNSGAITVSFTYSEVDADLKSSSPATVTMPFTTVSISGNIYDDANGLTDNTVNGVGTNSGGLNAVLYDAVSDTAIAKVAVAANGIYSFSGLNAGNYTVEITTNTATIGTIAPAVALPAGWVSTGENLGAGAGSDGTINSILPLGAISANTSNADFGIEQLPTANNVSGTFVNPGGTNTVQVPTLNGTDPEQGIFPGTGNADTVVINTIPSSGILYYNGTPVVAGNTINNYNPALLTFDPPSGSGIYTFTYSEIDGANQSSVPANVTLNFSAVSISGNVYDDANGLTDNTVNGIGTNAGGLNAVLTDAGGNVIAVTAVGTDGTYSFAGLDEGNYNVEITTNTATVSATAPAVALPAGWVSTGENLGAGAGSDGTVNSILSLGAVSATVTNADFGIEQLPVSDNKTYSIVAPTINSSITLNGSGLVPGPLSGSDPEDGTLVSNKTVIIKTVPTNSQLYYNGVLVTDNTTITNYDPTKLTLKFTVMGLLNTSFQYSFLDAAGNQNATPATYNINWTSTLPVVLTNFAASKENDYTLLNWTTSSELNVKTFNIERSTDNGATWQTIGEVVATGNSSEQKNYSYTDDNPESGTNLYRLQVEDNNGSFTYSNVTKIEIQDDGAMSVYPNPVGEEEALNIQLVGLKSGPYKITMISAAGQTVKEMTFSISNSGSALLVIPTGKMPRGTYIVIVNGNNQQYSKTVVVENR